VGLVASILGGRQIAGDLCDDAESMIKLCEANDLNA
jgi:hypothetical protein